MATGDICRDSSGNIMTDAGGNVILDAGAGCCGCCPCACDPPPATILVTFSGITPQTACLACGPGNALRYTTFVANKAFCLSYIGLCTWQWTGDAGNQMSFGGGYRPAACGADGDTPFEMATLITLQLVGGSWSLTANDNWAEITPVDYNVDSIWFQSNVAAACVATTASNSQTTPSCAQVGDFSFVAEMGTGGSATTVLNGC